MMLVRPEQSFHFAIALRVLDPAKDLLDTVGIQECLEPALPVIVAGELRPMVADALPDSAVLHRNFHPFDALLHCWAIALHHCQQRPAGIVFDLEHPNAILTALMPINMHRSQAVFSLVSDPFFLPHHFLEALC